MKLKKHIKNDKLKWWLTFGAITLLAIMVISLCVSIGNSQTTTTLSNSAYHIGTINTETGAIVDSKQNLYSDMKTTENMVIEIDDNAQITYKVVFYDENNDFVSATTSLSADFDNEEIPATATQFRLVVTPNQVDGENVTLNIFNMSRYIDMLNVEFAK